MARTLPGTALAMVLAMALTMALTVSSACAAAWTERGVASGGLHGVLTLPDVEARGSGVLILAGSGPVDRDGNLPGLMNNSLKFLAHALAERGIVSLRVDKRGVGSSAAAGGREEDLRFGTFVDDAAAWSAVLKREGRVERLVLLGHSEGALVATLVAQRIRPAGLVLLAGAGEPASAVIERQLKAAGAPERLQERSREIVRSLMRGEAVTDVPAELAPLYRSSVQNYLMSWLPLDPARELARTDCPILIVQGTSDLQVSVEDARRLHAARPSSRLEIVETMNHVLKDAPSERATNLATYRDPDRPLSSPLVPAIERFVR
ncbi:alpha/beta hydrolase [Enterovirga rhinocerotis]|uniref:Serine aminopeptidase S33 domain-containing protein n=1 Tax=Enterovirga rhinocerotis TaxID=1339210 RepID=A0A4V3DXX9_9HYPH|nr:alpha/beta fold hydrolase [Enterovirga rhinocerotis]TDR90469.1 hypothetical protein EV668_3320 [Enterovirga rhinocerotis]